jgi:hypothetical protein
MKTYSGNQKIKQLEKRKGGYFYLEVNADVVNQFEKKKATRIICTLDDALSYRCGLNHLGDGNFFIIIATKYLEKLGKNLGDPVNYRIDKDPDQLGVDVPEVLEVFLAQDADFKSIYEALTDGKKRSLELHETSGALFYFQFFLI